MEARISSHSDVENVDSDTGSTTALIAEVPQNRFKLKLFKGIGNLLVHILIGCTVGISLLFAFHNGLPLNATSMHIVLCVLGYQLLMAEGILSLTSDNSWLAALTLVDKRRAHWVLQILGSGLAIAGSVIKILNNSVHWSSYHGQFGLVALIFTAASLINGLSSLYAYELRGCIPSALSKISHICFGTVAFVTASVCLCYGFDMHSFKSWSSPNLSMAIIILTAIFTAIITINPLINFAYKMYYLRRY